MNYREEVPIFIVLKELNIDDFLEKLAQSNNPYFVGSVLFSVGAGASGGKYSYWKKLALAVPSAFNSDNTWNGSVLLPILLVNAYEQLMEARYIQNQADASDEDTEKLKQKINVLTDNIVSTLKNRTDAIPLLMRWSIRLMKHFIRGKVKEITDPYSRTFIEDSLLKAIEKVF